MILAAFQARCPFEIGDKIKERQEIHPVGLNFGGQVFTEIEHTITDIACVHYVKSGQVRFLYELDNSGKLVQLERESRKQIRNGGKRMDVQKVSREEMEAILETGEPLGKFLREDENHIWAAVDNSAGDAWTEYFRTEEEAKHWLRWPHENEE